MGLFAGFEIVNEWQEIVETQDPNPELGSLYASYYNLHREIYMQLREQFIDLVQLGKLSAEK